MRLVKKNICTREDCGGQYHLADFYGDTDHLLGVAKILYLIDALTGDEGWLKHIYTCRSRQCRGCKILDKQLRVLHFDPQVWRDGLTVECLLCGYPPGGPQAAQGIAWRRVMRHETMFCFLGKHLRTPDNTEISKSDGAVRCRDCRKATEALKRAA